MQCKLYKPRDKKTPIKVVMGDKCYAEIMAPTCRQEIGRDSNSSKNYHVYFTFLDGDIYRKVMQGYTAGAADMFNKVRGALERRSTH